MQWNQYFNYKQTVAYELLVPPFGAVPEKLKPRQVKEYFEWYISQVPLRVNYLKAKCSESLGIKIDKINSSPESLIQIWKWFLKICEIENTPIDTISKYKETMKGMPESFIEHMANYGRTRFSITTEYIIRDIGMYFGNLLIFNHPSLFWGYYTKPKSDFFVNKPVIQGFEDSNFDPPYRPSFEPIHMVTVQAAKIFKKEISKFDLYNLYLVWRKYVCSDKKVMDIEPKQ